MIRLKKGAPDQEKNGREMTDHPRTRLGPGGFAVMGTRMAHQFACQGTAACVMFVTFDRAYDIRWLKR
jgi:hypothetical protein